MKAITPSEAMSDLALLAAGFKGPSWNRWRAVLKAAYGEPLTPEEMVLFKEVAGDREPPKQQVGELWIVAGRRGGKDSVAAFDSERRGNDRLLRTPTPWRESKRYVPGQRQTTSPPGTPLHPGEFEFDAGSVWLLVKETDEALELSNGVEVIISTSTFRGVRGRSIAAAILDEVAFLRSEESSNPDFEIYQALAPGLVTLPGSMLIGISSPYRRVGLLFEKWRIERLVHRHPSGRRRP